PRQSRPARLLLWNLWTPRPCHQRLPQRVPESLRHYRESQTGLAARVSALGPYGKAKRQSLLDPTPTALRIRWPRRRLLPSLSAAPAWGSPNSPVPHPRPDRKSTRL